MAAGADAQTRALLAELPPPGGPTIAQLPLEMARQALRMLSAAKGIVVHGRVTTEEHCINADAGGPQIALRVYAPDAPPGADDLPAVLLLHGGGFMLGDLDTHDSIARYLSCHAPCVVVSVGYRRAPEHVFPAAIEDSIRATHWLHANAGRFGADPRRIVLLGDSAGGNLAAIVAQLAADAKVPAITRQVLLYPYLATDPHASFASRDRCGAGEYFLTLADVEHFRTQYLGTSGVVEDPRFSPLSRASLKGVPGALIITAGLDPLRDEAELYAGRLREAGVEVQYQCFESTIHGFASFAGCIDAGREALDLVCRSVAATRQTS